MVYSHVLSKRSSRWHRGYGLRPRLKTSFPLLCFGRRTSRLMSLIFIYISMVFMAITSTLSKPSHNDKCRTQSLANSVMFQQTQLSTTYVTRNVTFINVRKFVEVVHIVAVGRTSTTGRHATTFAQRWRPTPLLGRRRSTGPDWMSRTITITAQPMTRHTTSRQRSSDHSMLLSRNLWRAVRDAVILLNHERVASSNFWRTDKWLIDSVKSYRLAAWHVVLLARIGHFNVDRRNWQRPLCYSYTAVLNIILCHSVPTRFLFCNNRTNAIHLSPIDTENRHQSMAISSITYGHLLQIITAWLETDIYYLSSYLVIL